MYDITCSDCPWWDVRPATNSRLSTCPNCGTDQLHYAKHVDEIDPEPLPLPGPPIEVPAIPEPLPD